jgi:hypothetical protein
MTFRDELIEAGARALLDGRELHHDVRSNVTAILDAMLAHRSTVECPECGGTGDIVGDLRVGGPDVYPCPAGCTDGRVPRPERLAVVKPVESEVFVRYRNGYAPLKSPVFRILAPDLPEGTP